MSKTIDIDKIKDFFKSGDENFTASSKKTFMNFKKKIIKEYTNLDPNQMDVFFYFDYDDYSKALHFKLTYSYNDYRNAWKRDKMYICNTGLSEDNTDSANAIKFIDFIKYCSYIIDNVKLSVKFSESFLDIYKKINIKYFFENKKVFNSLISAEKLPEVLYDMIKRENYNVKECLEYLLENYSDLESDINNKYEKIIEGKNEKA